MMAAALQLSRNAWFLILSESDIPLYPPTVVYQQLMGGPPLSRINACEAKDAGSGVRLPCI